MGKRDFEKNRRERSSGYIFLPKLHFKCEKETLSFSVIVRSSGSRYGVDFTIAYVLLQKNASKVQSLCISYVKSWCVLALNIIKAWAIIDEETKSPL